jgi:hypothetical protein
MTGDAVVEYGFQPTSRIPSGFISINDLWVDDIPPCGGDLDEPDGNNGLVDYLINSYLFMPVMTMIFVLIIIAWDYTGLWRKVPKASPPSHFYR